MNYNVIVYELLGFLFGTILKGYFHLDYLKSVFPDKYGNLNYLIIFLTGSHYKAPQLMVPFIAKYPNLSENQKLKFILAWLATITYILIILFIIF